MRPQQLISDRFAVWKHRSWQSANRRPCSSAQPICECFAVWKRNSWTSANRPPSTTHIWPFPSLKTRFLSIRKSKLFHVGAAHIWTFRILNTRSWASANQPLCGTALPFLNVSQPEYVISEHQQINLIAGQHCPYLNFSQLEKWFLNISISTLLQDCTVYIWKFRSLKTRFLRYS